MNEAREVQVERLLGRRVRDEQGRVLGRVEEMRVDIIDGEPVVVEFHLGTGAFVERVAGFVAQLPFLGWLSRRRGLVVAWQDMDFSDIDRPVARAFTAIDARGTRVSRPGDHA